MSKQQSQYHWEIIERMPRCTFTLASPLLCTPCSVGHAFRFALAQYITEASQFCPTHWLEQGSGELVCSYCCNRSIDKTSKPVFIPAFAQIHYGPFVDHLCFDCYQRNWLAFFNEGS